MSAVESSSVHALRRSLRGLSFAIDWTRRCVRAFQKITMVLRHACPYYTRMLAFA